MSNVKLKVQMKSKAQSREDPATGGKPTILDFTVNEGRYFDIESFELHLTFGF